jgi:hypothetical protein
MKDSGKNSVDAGPGKRKNKSRPEQERLRMEEPGATQRSAADNPSGIHEEIAEEHKKPITNQDEQGVITNQGQTLHGADDRPNSQK